MHATIVNTWEHLLIIVTGDKIVTRSTYVAIRSYARHICGIVAETVFGELFKTRKIGQYFEY
jgi:hypothetical protein